jgi:hypothetical protein
VVGLLLALVFGWWYVTQPLLPIARTSRTTVEVSAARLESHVRALSERLIPRDYTHPGNLAQAAAYIRTEFTRAGGATSEQPYDASGRSYRNVVASFGPESGERIVVGAHYDVDGELPGADDNGSGVAGLIELAYLLGRSPPRMRVELVAYSLEELPFFGTPYMGSAVHARSLKEQRAEVRAMFSLEMIGYFSNEPASQQFPLEALRPFYPSSGNFIAIVGKPGQTSLVRKIKRAMRSASPLPVHSINAPRWVPGVDFSDHVSYWDAGYAAVMITDTAWYRNPNYHTARDIAETLDYERMAMVVQGVDAAVRAIAR